MNKKEIVVLLLGMGGNVSQGIYKALRASGLPLKIIGACVYRDSVGLLWCDESLVSPFASDPEFISWVIATCRNRSIDIIFTGVEENLIELKKAEQRILDNCESVLAISGLDKLEIGMDKFATCEWLKNHNCNYPAYSLSSSEHDVKNLAAEKGFPLIAKPRAGKGSQGIRVIDSFDEVQQALSLEDYVIEECIGTADNEYTVGCYRSILNGSVSIIVMHRWLKHGTTCKAEVVRDPAIEAEARKICEAFKPDGPLNIQLRKDSDGRAVCFELNVRFSGTTAMRARFGFQDVKAALLEYVRKENCSECFNILPGTAYRYDEEMYVFAEAGESR